MTERDAASAAKIQADAAEIAALVLEHMAAPGNADPAAATGAGVQILLAAAWTLGKRGSPDEAGARRAYVRRVREHADFIEALGGSEAGGR